MTREEELTSRLDNAKKRYESKCQELADCSVFSTKQALEINDFQSRTCESCKFGDGDTEGTMICRHPDDAMPFHVPLDFGCNKFERKEDDRK